MDLYTEIILDHFKNPKNKGTLKNPTKTATKHNTLCGDKLQIDLLLDKNGKVEKALFTGMGCALSQASADMLTEKLRGKTLPQIQKITPNEIFSSLFSLHFFQSPFSYFKKKDYLCHSIFENYFFII